MYKMPEFRETDPQRIAGFMRQYPFVTLTATDGSRVCATQVPVLVDTSNGRTVLRGHIMRKTNHHKALLANPEALVLFAGPHCYVSSGWYSQRNNGATWNYMTVQVRGKVTFLTEEETKTLLIDLTRRFEQGQAKPLFAEDLPSGYMDQMVKAIEGFRLVADDISATFKLSQNRDEESYRNIIRHLEQADDPGSTAIAEEMRRRLTDLF